jgi:putative ABC transport system substrate-binding protein
VPEKHRGALFVLHSPGFTTPERRRLPDFALRHRLPAMFFVRDYVVAGGLMSYGGSGPAMAAFAADYADLIAKRAHPGTLPIAQPPKFEFAINLKTAKALGLKLPRSILLRATEVIE